MTSISQNPLLQRILQALGAAVAIFIALVIATGIIQILLVLLALTILVFFLLKLPFVQRFIRRKIELNMQSMQKDYAVSTEEKDITIDVRVIETSEKKRPLSDTKKSSTL